MSKSKSAPPACARCGLPRQVQIRVGVWQGHLKVCKLNGVKGHRFVYPPEVKFEPGGLKLLRKLNALSWKPYVPVPLCPVCQEILNREGLVLGSMCPSGVDE